ncbi:MAG: dihydroneopterin aldolase [Bacteroidetes bacterium GWD2_45_23]|nr:MAG: dihydroneopterin aldolase [Bacteroidetes bacterium GWC2_46_850]OFX76854.1 MAG: dihydroneopterin aldolase [Bacteroidetes bacterium GWC1_47_7]OFX87110.1 MAG: dihydroneopterin aldolase [Bacteroidetes bacterium GWD2_45_23]HAR38375.1 dihydroneopterin aldolase [Porphyromonadaceae bacterium]HBB01802.1 dihydroneopterin aldolase [Porphyromonadaceae bacterium]
MKTTIELTNMQFYAYHGVLPQERETGNVFVVNMTLDADITAACASDEVADTINYADVFELVRTEMQQPSKLLEHLAGRIIKRLTSAFPQISYARVSVAKMHPPVNGEMEKAAIVLTATL